MYRNKRWVLLMNSGEMKLAYYIENCNSGMKDIHDTTMSILEVAKDEEADVYIDFEKKMIGFIVDIMKNEIVVFNEDVFKQCLNLYLDKSSHIFVKEIMTRFGYTHYRTHAMNELEKKVWQQDIETGIIDFFSSTSCLDVYKIITDELADRFS